MWSGMDKVIRTLCRQGLGGAACTSPHFIKYNNTKYPGGGWSPQRMNSASMIKNVIEVHCYVHC